MSDNITLDAALAEPEQNVLRRDAERYRWLKSRAQDYDGHVCFGDVRYPAPIPDRTPFDAIDAAIDAAMDAPTTPAAAAVDASTAPAMPCAYPHCCDKAGNRCPRMFAGLCSGPRAADPQQVGR